MLVSTLYTHPFRFEGLAFLSPCLHRPICVAGLLKLFLRLWLIFLRDVQSQGFY